MMTNLHAVKRRRINDVQGTATPLAALALGAWAPAADMTTLIVALAFLGVLLVMLRLRRQTRAEHAARLRAERQAALADNLQQLVAAVSRARTPAAVIEG